MNSNQKPKVAAIVPALNEERNVGNVLKVLLDSKDLQEVILVDDGSIDRTAEIGEALGVKVLRLPQKGGSGKGNAMRQGVKNTDAEIIVFFDADLIGLNQEHISLLVQPVLNEEVAMCVGIRERRGWENISEFLIKIAPLTAIAGERAIKREVFESIPVDFMEGFMVETAMNYYCKNNNLPVRYVRLENLDIVVKEKKWGLVEGVYQRLKMYLDFIKIRFLILKEKEWFK